MVETNGIIRTTRSKLELFLRKLKMSYTLDFILTNFD